MLPHPLPIFTRFRQGEPPLIAADDVAEHEDGVERRGDGRVVGREDGLPGGAQLGAEGVVGGAGAGGAGADVGVEGVDEGLGGVCC